MQQNYQATVLVVLCGEHQHLHEVVVIKGEGKCCCVCGLQVGLGSCSSNGGVDIVQTVQWKQSAPLLLSQHPSMLQHYTLHVRPSGARSVRAQSRLRLHKGAPEGAPGIRSLPWPPPGR